MWLSFTMLAAALWGVGQVFTKKGLEHTSPLFNNSIAAVVILVSTVPFALYHGVQFSLLPSIFLLTFFSALFMLSYYYIIGEGKISLTGTIMAMYPVVPIILSFVFLHEHPGIIQKFAGILVLVGTGVIAYGQEKTMKRFKLGRWFWLAIFCAIITGFGDFLSKLAINVSDAYTYLFAYGIEFFIITCFSFIFDKKGRKLPKKLTLPTVLPTILGVTMVELGLVAYYLALSKGLLSVVTPLSSIYVAITIVLAWIFLKEKINRVQFIGIIFSVVGIILLGVA